MKKHRILALILIMSVLVSFAGITYARAGVALNCGVDTTSTSGYYYVWGIADGTGTTTVKVSIASVGFSASGTGNGTALAGGTVKLTKGQTYIVTVTGSSGGYTDTKSINYIAK